MHLQDPLVSIVMAVKDTAPYLPACLDSIIAQSYRNWELIAVNDHSYDRSPEILETYAKKDPRIKIYHSSRPLLIPTLQEAYSRVSGLLVNRMDSDDIMPDYKLELLVNEWNKYGKGTVIAGGTMHFVDEGEVGDGFRRYEKWLNEVAKSETHCTEIYRECVIPSHSWIIHREDMDIVGAFDREVYPEDYDLCFRFYKYGLKIVGLDAVLHYWRDRSDRISRTWECYKDNRYFDLKLHYFYELDRDTSRPLVLWGAGSNGKDMAKMLLARGEKFHWVCDNDRKIGKHVYDVLMENYEAIPFFYQPQIMVVVTSPKDRKTIHDQLLTWGLRPVRDFWFFL